MIKSANPIGKWNTVAFTFAVRVLDFLDVTMKDIPNSALGESEGNIWGFTVHRAWADNEQLVV